MAKLLGILRHAKSDWSDGAKRDFDRGLNERGHKGALVMGDHIREDGQVWDKVIASPAERVKATFEVGLPEIELIFDDRLYLASPDTIFEVVQEHGGDSDAILISGHNPGLYETVLELVSPSNENDLFKELIAILFIVNPRCLVHKCLGSKKVRRTYFSHAFVDCLNQLRCFRDLHFCELVFVNCDLQRSVAFFVHEINQ